MAPNLTAITEDLAAMTSTNSPSSLFQVYLRLRPPISQQQDDLPERCLAVEGPDTSHSINNGPSAVVPTHITLQPPSDSRKRGVERFGFTQVFDESASQLNVFEDTELQSIIKGVLIEQRDGLVATLGVTGSGKSHTILGSKTQRGITQMSLDVIFRSLASTIKPADNTIPPILLASVAASDTSESQMFAAHTFLEAVYGEPGADRGRNSRAQTPTSSGRAHTPMAVWKSPLPIPLQGAPKLYPLGPWSISQCFYQPGLLAQTNTSTPSTKITPRATALNGPNTPQTARNDRSNTVDFQYANLTSRMIKEPTPALIFPRRHVPMRASTLPRSPDVNHLTLELNPHSEYIVLVSMYEVYNDRIFDLLSPAIVPGQGSAVSRQGTSSQKDRRKPLFFKSTEGSPDRKVVAGLRKIACSTYEEALAVLEIGLTERKVTGTGSNSVSSRSHGFFCLEIKRRMRNKRTGEETWIGNTLTVADLAGSERARNAKTAGSTLAEAGKINESLMYLGQCLQMQSGIQDGNKTAMVPYRQCKLTELLFSNSFPSNNSSTINRNPQKAIMIVTADPLGDYNATSQILRYSALAREVTVPRAPSAESILSSTLGSRKESGGRQSPQPGVAEELEKALAEIQRLTAENDRLNLRLTEEEILRAETETALIVSEDRCLLIEQEVREECWVEMDERMEQERKRWQSAWDEQTGRTDDHIDKKIELLSRGFQIHEDPQPSSDEQVEELEFENDQLRSKITALERELNCRSPSKKSKSKNTTLETSRNANCLGRESDIEVALRKMDHLKLADSMFKGYPAADSPGKKQRKISTRKWDFAPEDDLEELW